MVGYEGLYVWSGVGGGCVHVQILQMILNWNGT